MLSLVDKYRPRKFEDIIGQKAATDYLRARVVGGEAKAVLFVGPPGVGKTSLARIFANALHCDAPTPSPCGKCDTCAAFDRGNAGFNLLEYNGSQFREHKHAAETARLGKMGLWRRFGIFIDEVHGLDKEAADALLAAVEAPGEGTFFLFATTDREAVRPALLSRCVIVELNLLSPADCFGLLASICEEERITFEPNALKMLVQVGRGSARDLVKVLDQVSSDGAHVTTDLVAQRLSFGWCGDLLSYWHALLDGDIAGQEQAMARWQAPPERKASAIREFLLYCHNFDIARPPLSDVVNAAFHQVADQERSVIVSGFGARARAASMPPEAFWADIMGFWADRPESLDEIGLRMKMRRFNALVNRQQVCELPPPSLNAQGDRARTFRQRSGRSGGRAMSVLINQETGPAQYLTLAQAERIYLAATFLPQRHGLLFNTAVRIDHGRLGAGDEHSAGKLVSQLLHELGLRIRNWAGSTAPFHWIYLHSLAGQAVITELALHIPVDCGVRACRWLDGRVAELRNATLGGCAVVFDEIQMTSPPRTSGARVRRHWKLVRNFWRGVDPSLVHWNGEGGRGPLIDLLGAPYRGRGPVGALRDLARFQTSRDLGPAARKAAEAGRMKLLSAFADAAWSEIDKGWELKEHCDRLAEEARRQEQADLILAEWRGPGQLEALRRDEALGDLAERQPRDPHDRRRTWVGWWK